MQYLDTNTPQAKWFRYGANQELHVQTAHHKSTSLYPSLSIQNIRQYFILSSFYEVPKKAQIIDCTMTDSDKNNIVLPLT